MPIDEIQRRLVECRVRETEARRIRKRIEETDRDQESRLARQRRLADRLRDEQQDVERLEGNTLTALYHWVMNDKSEVLERERTEMVEAKIRFDEAAAAVDEARSRGEELRRALAAISDPEHEIASLEGELEVLLTAGDSAAGAELREIGGRETELASAQAEIVEAQRAGETALLRLQSVSDSLSSAASWGTWDMLGGGMVATYVKQQKMRDAQQGMASARGALEAFDHELRDVQRVVDSDLELDGLTSFADYFFDGLFIDWIVQSKINDGKRSVDAACGQVRSILRGLARDLDGAREESRGLSGRRAELLSQFS